jgi:hypothetical protein
VEIIPHATTQNYRKTLGMNLLIGTDHWKGCWCSLIKVFSRYGHYGRTFHKRCKHEKKEMIGDCGYYFTQTASINLKKDYSLIHTITVTYALDNGYDKLKGSQLVEWYCSKTGATELVLYKRSHKLAVEGWDISRASKKDEFHKEGRHYVHCLFRSPFFFITLDGVVTYKMRTASKSRIVRVIPCFTLYITGDLTLYADSLGKMKLFFIWCIYCMLTRLQWKSDVQTTGELLTEETIHTIHHKLIRERNVEIAERKGITSLPH